MLKAKGSDRSVFLSNFGTVPQDRGNGKASGSGKMHHGSVTCAGTILTVPDNNDEEAVMTKLECEVVSITGDHNRISLESNEPVPSSLALDEIEHRIV
jgi:hypothetical protein